MMYLSLPKFAEYLSVDVNTVRQLIDMGMPFVVVNPRAQRQHRRINPREAVDWLKRNRPEETTSFRLPF